MQLVHNAVTKLLYHKLSGKPFYGSNERYRDNKYQTILQTNSRKNTFKLWVLTQKVELMVFRNNNNVPN